MEDVSGRRRSRGVSTTVGYILNLTVALLLVTTLLAAAGTFVEDQRQRAVHDELEVNGGRLASSIESVDRLAAAGGDASIEVFLPKTVAGRDYRVEVNDANVTLRTTNPDVRVTVQFQTETDVAATTVNGGRLLVSYDESQNRLEVSVADG